MHPVSRTDELRSVQASAVRGDGGRSAAALGARPCRAAPGTRRRIGEGRGRDRRLLQAGRGPDLRGLHLRAVARATRGPAGADRSLHQARRQQRPGPAAGGKADTSPETVRQVRADQKRLEGSAAPSAARIGRNTLDCDEQEGRRSRAQNPTQGSGGSDTASHGQTGIAAMGLRAGCRLRHDSTQGLRAQADGRRNLQPLRRCRPPRTRTR